MQNNLNLQRIQEVGRDQESTPKITTGRFVPDWRLLLERDTSKLETADRLSEQGV